MTDMRSHDVDTRIRDAFPPDSRSAARIARTALAPRRRSRQRWLAIAAAAAIAVLAAALTWRPWQASISHRARAGSDDASLTGSFTDGVLVVPLPDGSVSIVGGEAREDRPPDGYGIVLVEGELR